MVTKDPSDGFAELQYEVVAETDEGALRRGLEDYRDLRLDAGLSPHDPPYASLPHRGPAGSRSSAIKHGSNARRTCSIGEIGISRLLSHRLRWRYS